MRELLEKWNPWWQDGRVPAVLKGRARPRYLEPLFQQTKERRVSVVTGPRRGGKTTLLYQVIDRLVESGTQPKSILYAQMDHPGLRADIGTVIREFRKLQKLDSKEKVFLFLDEAQHAENWAGWAKAIFDAGDGKLFISGSTTAMLEMDARACLTGRWTRTCVWPLDLGEYLDFRAVRITGAERYLESAYLREYIYRGGFPEAVLEDQDEIRTRHLVELFDDFVFKDAARSRNIRDLTALRDIAVLLLGMIGKPASINKMRNTLKISADAVSASIDALTSAYLFVPCRYFSKSMNERIYNPRKYYAIDTGMAAAVLGRFGEGIGVENIIALHFSRKGDIWYWKSDGELDFVLDRGKLALESKFMNDIGEGDLKGALQYAKRARLGSITVATDEAEGINVMGGIEVRLVPSARLLLGGDKT